MRNLDTYNYSLPGAKYALKGVDGLKTGRLVELSTISHHQRKYQRLIAVIMGEIGH